uniref:Uncharacterized protein n=1 Tax=Romanomermis culicivorax TaxID=13658 RepID=A0A915HVN7_ROMCU
MTVKKESDIATLYGISAAHCFFKSDRTSRVPIDKLGFLFGLHDLRILTPHTVYRKANLIHINPDFNTIRVQNDLAVVKFTKKITFNSY